MRSVRRTADDTCGAAIGRHELNTDAMKYLAQTASSPMGKLVGFLPFVALAVYMVGKLAALVQTMQVG